MHYFHSLEWPDGNNILVPKGSVKYVIKPGETAQSPSNLRFKMRLYYDNDITIVKDLGTNKTGEIKLTKAEADMLANKVTEQNSAMLLPEVDVILDGKVVYKISTFLNTLVANFDESYDPEITGFEHEDIEAVPREKLGVYTGGLSRLKIKTKTRTKNNARVINYKIDMSSGFVSDSYLGQEVITKILKNTNKPYSAKAYITDSRGRTAQKELPFLVYGYNVPKHMGYNYVQRVNKNGFFDPFGEYVKINGHKIHYYMIGKNKASVLVRRKEVGNSNAKWETMYEESDITGTPVPGNDSVIETQIPELYSHMKFDVYKAYNIEVIATDNVQSVTKTYYVTSDATIMDFRGDGQGMAIGKISQKKGFEVGYPSEFHKISEFKKGLEVSENMVHKGSGDVDAEFRFDKNNVNDYTLALKKGLFNETKFNFTEKGEITRDYKDPDTMTVYNSEFFHTHNVFRGRLKDGTDLNTVVQPGIYNYHIRVSDIKNAPDNTSSGLMAKGKATLVVIPNNHSTENISANDEITQIVTTADWGISVRIRAGKEWYPWNQLGYSRGEPLDTSSSSTFLSHIKRGGSYFVTTTREAEKVSDAPVKRAFYLEVQLMNNGNLMQIFTTYDGTDEYIRTYYAYEKKWSQWAKRNHVSYIFDMDSTKTPDGTATVYYPMDLRGRVPSAINIWFKNKSNAMTTYATSNIGANSFDLHCFNAQTGKPTGSVSFKCQLVY